MRTRTAVVLVGSVVLLLAASFAALAWAAGGMAELVAFVTAFAVLLGVVAVVAALTRRALRR